MGFQSSPPPRQGWGGAVGCNRAALIGASSCPTAVHPSVTAWRNGGFYRAWVKNKARKKKGKKSLEKKKEKKRKKKKKKERGGEAGPLWYEVQGWGCCRYSAQPGLHSFPREAKALLMGRSRC